MLSPDRVPDLTPLAIAAADYDVVRRAIAFISEHWRDQPETEAIAMRAVMEYERSQQHQVEDVHEKNLGYDITSLDTASGELRLIEIKGLAGETGIVALTPNEKRVAEDRRDCYWLYVVTRCKQPDGPRVMLIGDPARLAWHEVKKVEHYQLPVSALTSAASEGAQE